ncbi:Tn3 family transposase [Streptomyces europaeiscabiei]|uniref:Tn3 family transposase n=1 Tax=Streptomyces europaeiscabiei TaxID=146819 RepID=UPI0029A2AA88|nr:Tn3 family transposase [Streptomyces europaeiscabiei]MDX2524732.1 Tn3 family transposase [Streptomyces europaeiscabiei]MDX3783537.1 Tn3 family transposase [Streptomyces europaeiscabiei]
MARTPLDLDELVEHWTLLKDEQALVSGKRGATRLGFAVLLKFYTQYGRFPRNRTELPGEAVEFVARQVQVPALELESYDWTGRTVEYHRAQIREHLGFRECSVADAEKLTAYLAEHVAHKERRPEQVRVELLARCRTESIEPPTPGRCDRIVGAALREAEESLTALISSRLTVESIERIVALAAGADQDDAGPAGGGTEGDDAPPVLAKVKEAPGNVSLETMLTEIDKLLAVRAIGLPRDLFIDVAPKVVAGWRARAAVESPSHLRTHPVALRVTLLAALLHEREREITDTLVELLISTVHRIGARAEKKVTEQLINAFKKVSGKENLLFKLAEASLGTPEGTVRQVVFPAVSGGEATLRELVHEFKTRGPVYRRTVQTTLKASYTNHYRRGLIKLLDVLEFRSSNHAHRPVIEALALVARYANAGNTTYYPLGETVPVHKAMGGDWAEVVHRTDKRGRRRVVRMVYEVVSFQALRDQLKCKEIWVVGADKWRNPDEDLPQDFEARRAENYRELRKPLDAAVFVDELREQMTAELTLLNDGMPKLSWLDIAERKSGAIRLTAAEAQPEPRNLRRIKAEVQRRWGIVPLVDMLKEAVLRTGCLDAVTSVSGGGSLSPEVLAERLLLVIYAYGTNTGIKAVASGGHGHTEDELRYVRRRYLSAEAARAIAIQIANATFAARSTELWGQGSTAVASDSTHVRAYDQNLFTEWHSRYGGRGVLIYWHVEKKSLAIHSQLINCTASEVAAMIEGAMRHGTTMDVEANYTDSHGQSEIGFGITRLLNFDLLPRIKRINKVKLYRPVAGEPDAYPQLTPALTRPIRWELITQQYDQMIKYATAIRTRTASTEAILRRFTRNASHHTYAAMLEVGRAQKTIFVARYLRLRDLQREIEEGLNVMESSNGASSVIAYGKGGEIASNRRDEQEMFVLCLRILQSALVYVNTLMLQDILGEPEWADLLTPADRRGLTPLFWSHVRPYGEVNLDMDTRLNLPVLPVPGPRTPADAVDRPLPDPGPTGGRGPTLSNRLASGI